MDDGGMEKSGTVEDGGGHGHGTVHLHIFVNRRKFDEHHGVHREMTGAQIAALVGVPAENAVVRQEVHGELQPVPLDKPIEIKNGAHFLVTRRKVEGGDGSQALRFERVERELGALREGGQSAELIEGGHAVVLYRSIPTDGARLGLSEVTDVIVPVPPGYPAALIDLAGLPVGSPLIPHVKGGQANHGILDVDGRKWRLLSYHPHTGGGGPTWDQTKHGFHTYLDHLIAWLFDLC